jgi:ketosteroid isomerase-like protein
LEDDMTTTASTSTPTATEHVLSGFQAFAEGDLETFLAGFAEDATWNHRNDDHLGGIHAGREGIKNFIVQSGVLTEGTLRAVPTAVLTDAGEHVAVAVVVSGTRPDGRTFEDQQIMLFVVRDGLTRTADQYVGDPTAVKAFWA